MTTQRDIIPRHLPAQNPLHELATRGISIAQTTQGVNTETPTDSASYTRNAIWNYVKTVPGPVRGPQPKLAQGSGATGGANQPGSQAALPGYVADNDYKPDQFGYYPSWRTSFVEFIPRSIPVGSNGREVVGTYQPHDFTPGQRFLNHFRRAEYWQVQEFPPTYRDLQSWQQVQKYRVQSNTLSARPLPTSNYFLGYQIDQTTSAAIGANALGYMSSS